MANWPGLAALPALVGRAGFARKSVQLPFATGATPPESDAPEIIWGTGDPNGAMAGAVGDQFIQTDAVGGRTVWTKAVGSGTFTGWYRLQTWDALRYFSPLDYGTLGTSDDSIAFAAAITAAKVVAGVVVVPPPDVANTPYILGTAGAMTATAVLTLNGRVSLLGSGSNDGPILQLANGANRSLVEIGETSQGNRIQHLRLEGNKANQTGTSYGIRCRNVTAISYQDSRYLFDNLLIQNFLTSGVLTEANVSEVRMLFVITRSNGSHGFDINGSDTRLIECESGTNGGKGLVLTQGFSRVIGGAFYLNTSYNIHVASTATFTRIDGCDLDRSQLDNVRVEGSNTSVHNCMSRDPGQATDLTYSHIDIAAGLVGVTIIGNHFKAKSLANQAVYCIRWNGSIANGATGPNSYDALSFGADRILIFGTPGPDFFYGRPRRAKTLVYGVTVNTDLSLGDDFALVVTDGVAFTMALPTKIPVSPDVQHIVYEIVNSSGGAMGAITWNGNFLLAGAFTNPANGKRRTIMFKASGTTLVELCRAAADI
jgi:hypothetical protein